MWTWKADRPVGTIVIIHGASEYHGRYKWLVEMWRSSGYNVVMGDLPGQERRPAPEGIFALSKNTLMK